MSEATSRVADATAAVAGGVVGAAVEGVIGVFREPPREYATGGV
jgi:hypothetical protein